MGRVRDAGRGMRGGLLMMDVQGALESFDGVARLFPLPNLVMFPGADQGLHIFEHRYRQMTADALASDRFIALVLLRPDWESEYDGEPPIETTACLCAITHAERLVDGRYNLRVHGLARFAIDEEFCDDDKPYRTAAGSVVAEVTPNNLGLLAALRLSLRNAVLERFASAGNAFELLSALFSSDLALGELCDRLASVLPLSPLVKQSLLAEADAAIRVELLIAALNVDDSVARTFPPPFSAN